MQKSKKVCLIGSGYVGLVTGACFAQVGHQVICVDKDQDKIENLKKGLIPIYETGLKKLVQENFSKGRLSFTTDLKDAVEQSEAIFIAVGTPSSRRGNGYADLTYVYQVAKEIASCLSNSKPKVVIDKSTVPVGTAEQVARIIQENNPQANFFVASNPEFLREGAAVKDFLEPDRVVIGTDDARAEKVLKEVYAFVSEQNRPILATSISSAELIKYASNSFLATKISFINEIANLCEKVGADVQDVAKGMGLDRRIGALFLQPGPGYGGSCFPKDVTALLRIAQENETPLRVLESVNEANIAQKAKMVFKIKHALGGQLLNKRVLFLGLTFKANTDDMRESQALTIIPALVERGAKIWAHDPEGTKEAQKVLPEEVNFKEDFYNCEEKLDAVVLLTDWDAYKQLDFQLLKKQMEKNPVFIDLRNVYSPEEVKKQGFQYFGVGR